MCSYLWIKFGKLSNRLTNKLGLKKKTRRKQARHRVSFAYLWFVIEKKKIEIQIFAQFK